MGTDPDGRGYIRTLGSTAGDRNSYTGQPSSLKGMLCMFQSFSFIEHVVLYRFGRLGNIGVPALYHLAGFNMPRNLPRQESSI